jgi:hypothetical protein
MSLRQSLDDLQGLLCFLQAAPLTLDNVWRWVLQRSTSSLVGSRLQALLSSLMWRSSKADVELGIPPQEKQMIPVHFDEIGRYFYRRVHEDVQAEASRTYARFNHLPDALSLDSLSPHDRALLVRPFDRLWKACGHPRLARNVNLLGSSTAKTMAEVQHDLVAKAVVRCLHYCSNFFEH